MGALGTAGLAAALLIGVLTIAGLVIMTVLIVVPRAGHRLDVASGHHHQVGESERPLAAHPPRPQVVDRGAQLTLKPHTLSRDILILFQ